MGMGALEANGVSTPIAIGEGDDVDGAIQLLEAGLLRDSAVVSGGAAVQTQTQKYGMELYETLNWEMGDPKSKLAC